MVLLVKFRRLGLSEMCGNGEEEMLFLSLLEVSEMKSSINGILRILERKEFQRLECHAGLAYATSSLYYILLPQNSPYQISPCQNVYYFWGNWK